MFVFIIGISFVAIASISAMSVAFNLGAEEKTPEQLLVQFLIAAWTIFGGIYLMLHDC